MIQLRLKYLFKLALIISFLMPSSGMTFGEKVISPLNINGLVSNNIAAEDMAEIKSLLKKISTYDHGQSREYLSQLINLMMITMNDPDLVKQTEKEFLKFLDSDATNAAKQFICERLSFIATDVSISGLLTMLRKASTSEMALYTLDRIPGQNVDKKLIEELDKADVNLKAGIITSLGRREAQNAVAKISSYIDNPDSMLANAAIEALANVGGKESIQALVKARKNKKYSMRATGAYLRCADKLSDDGNIKQAHKIYSEIFETVQTKHFQFAALQGMVLTSGDRAPEIIGDILTSNQNSLYSVVIPLIKYIKPNQEITHIAKALPNLPATNQVQLIAALEHRKNPTVKQVMLKAVENENAQVRSAAIKSLTAQPDPSLVPIFAKKAAKSSGSEKVLARESIVILNGTGIDAAIMDNLPNAETDVKVEYIRALGERGVTEGAPLLMQCLEDEAEDCRLEALKAMRKVAAPQHLNKLLAFHGKTNSEKEREEAVNAIVAAAAEQGNAQTILTKIENTNDIPTQASLVEAMGRIGDKITLPAIRAKLTEENEQLKLSAIRALASWPTAEPMNDLMHIAKESGSNQHRVLALRGYIDLIPLQENKAGIVNQYLEAMKLAENISEKRMVLSGLSRVRTYAAVNAIANYLGEEQLQREAERAILRIAPRLNEDDIKKTVPLLKKIADNSNNDRIKNNIRELLDEISEDQ